MDPHISAVHGHINGDVSNDSDAAAVGVFLDPAPLAEKVILAEGPEGHLLLQLLLRLGQRFWLTQPQRIGPLLPGTSPIPLLEGHIEAVVLQPAFPGVNKFHQLRVPPVTAGKGPQQMEPVLVDNGIIHPGRVLSPVPSFCLSRQQQPFFLQHSGIDKVGVAGKGGKALIRTVSIAGGSQRQHLPAGLSCRGQKVHKFSGRTPQGADAPGRGKAGHRQPHTTAPGKRRLFFQFHVVLSPTLFVWMGSWRRTSANKSRQITLPRTAGKESSAPAARNPVASGVSR